jgi:glucokinase
MSMKAGIGIDMGGTRIKIGLVNDGEILASTLIQASAHVNLEERLREIGNEVDRLLNENRCEPLGIGLAFPGIVDSVKRQILSRYVKYPDAQHVDLSNWAYTRWQVPLVLENDARAALVGEWQYGAGKDCDNLVLITLGTGVGTAALINGKLLHGKHYLAGSLGGHMSINLHGDVCNCGNLGCVESEASTWALQKLVTRDPGFHSSTLSKEPEINFSVVFSHARAGDKLAMMIQQNSLKAWSLAIINLIHAYDPERVVIGGGIMKSKDLIIPYAQEMIKKDTWINNHVIELVTAKQVEYAGILGMYHLITLINGT